MDHLENLFQSLKQRRRPEDVADLIILRLDGRLAPAEQVCLQKAAQGSLRQMMEAYTSMLEDFALPVGLQRQVTQARLLFASAQAEGTVDGDDPEAVEGFIRRLSQEIGKSFGQNDFKADRLNHQARQSAGLEISRRRYNKLFRHLTRMETKLQTLLWELKKLQLTKIGKSGLAHTLPWEEFSTDLNTACFIAYYTARCNLRSEFTIYGQQRPYDEIADMLFARCRTSPTTNWWAIAHVFPRREVLDHLPDSLKGELLGRWFAILEDIAGMLAKIWTASEIDRQTMVVRQGNDSTTWNNTANAWNKARDNWIAILEAMDIMEEMLEIICFGKVLRLMAADVAAWHISAGRGLNPDTFVWNELPLPWQVFSGQQHCTLDMVEEACRKHGVDPVRTGWTQPRPRTAVVPFKPTPELVHGVSVANPHLAKLLRDTGFFSGKRLNGPTAEGAGELHHQVLRQHFDRLTGEMDSVE